MSARAVVLLSTGLRRLRVAASALLVLVGWSHVLGRPAFPSFFRWSHIPGLWRLINAVIPARRSDDRGLLSSSLVAEWPAGRRLYRGNFNAFVFLRRSDDRGPLVSSTIFVWLHRLRR